MRENKVYRRRTIFSLFFITSRQGGAENEKDDGKDMSAKIPSSIDQMDEGSHDDEGGQIFTVATKNVIMFEDEQSDCTRVCVRLSSPTRIAVSAYVPQQLIHSSSIFIIAFVRPKRFLHRMARAYVYDHVYFVQATIQQTSLVAIIICCIAHGREVMSC